MFDAALDDAILRTITSAATPLAQTLFDGEWGIKYAHVGPYLVDLGEPHTALLQQILEVGWGKNWGLFLTSDDGFEQTRNHLRKLMIAQMPDGTNLYFRFFDPRIIGVLAPTLESDQSMLFPPTMVIEQGGGRRCLLAQRAQARFVFSQLEVCRGPE